MEHATIVCNSKSILFNDSFVADVRLQLVGFVF